MKTKRGKAAYKVPADVDRIVSIIIDDRKVRLRSAIDYVAGYLMYALTPQDMWAKIEAEGADSVVNRPMYYSFISNELYLYPTPTATYNIVVTYEPKVKQF